MGQDKKKTFLIIVLVVIIAALGTYALWLYRSGYTGSAAMPEMPTLEGASVQVAGERDTAVIVRSAIDSRNKTICALIKNQSDRKGCIMNVLITKASDAKDPALCDALESPAFKTSCIDSVIIVKARDAKDPKLCNTMTDTTRISSCVEAAK